MSNHQRWIDGLSWQIAQILETRQIAKDFNVMPSVAIFPLELETKKV